MLSLTQSRLILSFVKWNSRWNPWDRQEPNGITEKCPDTCSYYYEYIQFGTTLERKGGRGFFLWPGWASGLIQFLLDLELDQVKPNLASSFIQGQHPKMFGGENLKVAKQAKRGWWKATSIEKEGQAADEKRNPNESRSTRLSCSQFWPEMFDQCPNLDLSRWSWWLILLFFL